MVTIVSSKDLVTSYVRSNISQKMMVVFIMIENSEKRASL